MTKTNHQNPVSDTTFNAVRERFGWCASWALWSPAGAMPKSGIADLGQFEGEKLDKTTLKLLHADVIFVGLNFSRNPDLESFANFHSGKPTGQDYKLRHALQGTPFWGAYMTDIIKDYVEVSSTNMMKALRNDPSIETASVQTFLEEIDLLGAKDPLLVALGSDTHKILTRNFAERFRIKRVPHYANYVAPQAYREQVLAALAA